MSGFWGQNIGNAFFNVGGKWILERLFGEDKVDFIQDQPGYRTFHDASKGNPKNDFGLLAHLDVDYIVLQGPVLTEHMLKLWGPTLAALTARGTKIILLGAAFFKFRPAELQAVRHFLDLYPPALISTRDPDSYAVLRGWGLPMPIYSGLDSAFFAPLAYTPFTLVDAEYYAFNFDRYPEPTVRTGTHATSDISFSFDDVTWNLDTPRLVSKLAHRSKVQAYLGHALDRRSLPIELNGHRIVRPEHRFNPHMTYKIYQHANAVASDEPWTYFTLYANSRLTLADRVHACVITLAYGGTAMLFTPSPRAALFERVNCSDIRKHPVSLDRAYLDEERETQLQWLQAKV